MSKDTDYVRDTYCVLILIILEVLYEFLNTMTIEEVKQCLNPYYTGSTL